MNQFEDKGKIFTPVITKKPVEVFIQTTENKIKGKVYTRPSDRLIDELNKGGIFIAVTDAILYTKDGKELFQAEFLTINTSQIVWILPVDEVKTSE